MKNVIATSILIVSAFASGAALASPHSSKIDTNPQSDFATDFFKDAYLRGN